MDGRFSDREPATRGLVDLEYRRSLVSVVALRRRGTNVEISRDWEPLYQRRIERTLKSLQTNDFIKVMVGNVTVSTNDVPTADKPMELFLPATQKPSARPVPTRRSGAEGSDGRFLRSQLRCIGPGRCPQARPCRQRPHPITITSAELAKPELSTLHKIGTFYFALTDCL
jgi:hypothetical protein